MPNALLPAFNRVDLSFTHGEGVRLTAANGETYLDFAAGIAVNALGHCHPALVNALKTQGEKLWHVSNLYRIPEQERAAERLVQLSFADYAFFVNSGAEAVECALKMARRYHYVNGAPGRYRVITFEGAFHGRTLATIAAGGQAKYLEGYGPPVDGFDQVPFGDLDAVQRALTPQTAAILVEPIQGEGGMRALSPEQMRALRKLADDNGLLLIFDEVQCGLGRTGKLFAYEWSGIAPDIMALAKGLGGGFPVGACLATARAGDAIKAGTHGTTFGGNPLAMAIACTVLDEVARDDFLQHVRDVALYARQRLASVHDQFPDLITEVRGQGLMLGLKLALEPARLVEALRAHHVLSVSAGDHVVRLVPPLVVERCDIDEAITALEKACADLRRQA